MGQVMDTETRADRSLQQFTMERYRIITKYRTAYHTFQMPVSLALYLVRLKPFLHSVVCPEIRSKALKWKRTMSCL
jgi:hypothetical protein